MILYSTFAVAHVANKYQKTLISAEEYGPITLTSLSPESPTLPAQKQSWNDSMLPADYLVISRLKTKLEQVDSYSFK